MKRITSFKPLHALLLFSSMMSTGALAQEATITEGQKGTFYFLQGTHVSDVGFSPDQRYIGCVGFYTEGVPTFGYIYDLEKDSLWQTEVPAQFILSPDWYAGGASIYKNGETIPMETRSTSEDPFYSSASSWAASTGLDSLFTMSFENPVNPATGRNIWVNYAYVVNGNTGKILSRIEPHWDMTAESFKDNSGHGERVNCASNDGSIVAGHSSDPESGHNWSPVFWDLAQDTSFSVGDAPGSLSCINNDGSIIIGNVYGYHYVLIRYNKEEKTFTTETIPFAPGMGYMSHFGISENGWIVMSQAPSAWGSSTAYMYNYQTSEMIPLADYVEELYGLELPVSNFAPSNISDDARLITGGSANNGADVACVITLEEQQIFAKARQFSARQAQGQMAVALQWKAPLNGQYTLAGYNVFCDSVQLNAELIAPTETSFLQTENVESGIHIYSIQAVYEEGVSDYRDAQEILIVDIDGCLPVQSIGHNLVYNRYANVYWSLPSSRMATTNAYAWDGTLRSPAGPEASERTGLASSPRIVARNNAKTSKATTASGNYRNENLDLIETKTFERRSMFSAFLDGNRLYAVDNGNRCINVYDYESMELLESYPVSEVSSLLNIAKIGNYIYAACDQNDILILDPQNMSVSNRIRTEETVVYLCYVPELNEGQGGLIYGDWETIHFCNMRGQEVDPGVDIDITGLIISGMAYHDGMLYILSQTGESLDELYTVDFSTGEFIGKKVLSDDSRLSSIETRYGFCAGGMTLSVLEDSTIALSAVLQFTATRSHLALFEVESAPGLIGYNLYRNDVKINPEGTYVQGLGFIDTLDEAGTYTYTVEPVHTDGCTGAILEGVETTVTIAPIGECPGPQDLTAYESNRAVAMEWSYTAETGSSLVGFNLYRNGERIAEELLDLHYTDFNRAIGDYTYVVEAFHDNSCVSSDTVELSVTHEGQKMAPSHIALSSYPQGESFAVDARWELPYFEQPLGIGFCNDAYSGTALADGQTMYAAIGWDSTRLNEYRDLYLVGIEFFIGNDVEELSGIVYLNDTFCMEVPMRDRIREAEWNTLMFDQYIPMDQPMEVVTGYKVRYSEAATAVAAYDRGPAVRGFGDLMSADGQQWTILSGNGIDANWCINGLVVKKRDLEEAAKTAMATGISPKVKAMSLSSLGLKEPARLENTKATSESLKLRGFNIYRDGVKLNDKILTGYTYTDTPVAVGGYDYTISAVYDDGEQESDPFYIEVGGSANEGETQAAHLRVYPNPASERLFVDGEYASAELLSLSGKIMQSFPVPSSELSLEGLESGVYFLRFVLPDGATCTQKIIIQ